VGTCVVLRVELEWRCRSELREQNKEVGDMSNRTNEGIR
jgi:hypothetical protein